MKAIEIATSTTSGLLRGPSRANALIWVTLLATTPAALAQNAGKEEFQIPLMIDRSLPTDYCNITPTIIPYRPDAKSNINAYAAKRLDEIILLWRRYKSEILLRSFDRMPKDNRSSSSGINMRSLIVDYFVNRGIPKEDIWTSDGPNFKALDGPATDDRYRVEVVANSRTLGCILEVNKRQSENFRKACEDLEGVLSKTCGKMSDWLHRNLPQ